MSHNPLFYTSLYRWYDIHHRVLPWRETTDPYKIWLSEVILQQTRVSQGMDYYHRFVAAFPRVSDLAAAAEDEVLRLWQGLGYYSRARNLHRAAQMVASRYQSGSAGTPAFPATFDELRALPGVGDYTAGAIASFAYDMPYPALDGNVYRVLARLYDCDMAFDTSAGKRHFHRLALELLDRDHPRLFNSAIMEFGALHCLPAAPDCEQCPLQVFCRAYAAGTVSLLPVRKPRPVLRDRWFTYTIYITPTRETLIRRRTDKDIWHHLYEFPLTEHASEKEWLNHQSGAAGLTFTHTLSHQRLHARFVIVPVDSLPALPGTMAVAWQQLDDYAFSRLTLNALDKLKNNIW